MLLKTHAILVLFVSSMLYSCASTSVSDDQAKGATGGTTVKTSAYRDLSVSKWVHAKSGLVMRDAPSKTAKRIELIPPYIKVRCVKELITEETIEGVIGAWTFVEWERVQGWVFGGFLSTKKPAVILQIQNQAYAYYKRSERTGHLYGPDSSPDDITVTELLGSYAVVKHRLEIAPAGDIADVDSVWWFMGADWTEVTHDSDTGMWAHLLYLNNDGCVDYITSGSCCGNDEVEICFGSKSGYFDSVYRSPDGCMVVFESMGKGDETVIRIRDNMTNKVTRLKFDSGRNTMVPVR